MLLDDVGESRHADAGDDGERAIIAAGKALARPSLPGDGALSGAGISRLVDLLRRAVAIVSDRTPACVRGSKGSSRPISTCLSQDDISDAYYPFGRNNMLEVAFLAAHLLWMTYARRDRQALRHGHRGERPSDELSRISASQAGADASRRLDQCDVVDVLRFHAPPGVIGHGRRVDLERIRKLAGL